MIYATQIRIFQPDFTRYQHHHWSGIFLLPNVCAGSMEIRTNELIFYRDQLLNEPLASILDKFHDLFLRLNV
ncbi:MAG: hypothetical protein ACI9IA_001918 [Enterobacterales bacterium]|jgi:hypothetical protein